jgi:stress-induced morphogen
VHVQRQIEDLLTEALSPERLDVVNESSMHNVPKGSETHFKVVIVSTTFRGRSAVERHRQVYAALAAPLGTGVHALAITARTPEEWEASQAVAASPPCLGGSKADQRS